MSLTLTDEQNNSIELAKEWYLNKSYTKPFVLLGCAGSGKSTIVKYLIELIGIHPTINVRYVTFTGKAASVLIKKGNPATTIHKLIYDPVLNDKGEITGFTKKTHIDSEIQLIVVDEFYMVNKEIMNDLLSFGIKTICLGDPNQLPPPMGEASELCLIPDATLTQPLRQALDNPIIYLADQARQHKYIRLGDYGNGVKVIRKNELDLEALQNADQIIAGKNDTVKKMNSFYRKVFMGINSDCWCPRKGEKLICLRNNWNVSCYEDHVFTNLVNGLGCYLENDLEIMSATYHANAKLRPDFFNDSVFNVPIDMLYFKHGFTTDKELIDKENIVKFDYGNILKKRKVFFDEFIKINKLTFGYTITCHKSQGSEWDKVFFIFEPFRGPRDPLYWQMLYTGITRASKELIVAI